MYNLNKIIGAFLNPLGVGLLLLLAAGGLEFLRRWRALARIGRWGSWVLIGLAFGWLWLCSTGIVGRWIGLSLEREFPPMLAERMPQADAIVVLGGGSWENTNACPYAELFQSSDRIWHGARLYKAGRAPRILITNRSDARLMVDLGVPREAILGPSAARNTEEEARLLRQTLGQKVGASGGGERLRILLVTSAWHMRRAKLMFERYATGVEVIPAATDHESTTLYDWPVKFKEFVPDPGTLAQNAALMKEVIAYYGYKWLR